MYLHPFNWEQTVSNCSIDKKIFVFNDTINNVMSSYIPNETKVSAEENPPWVNAEIENLITAKKWGF